MALKTSDKKTSIGRAFNALMLGGALAFAAFPQGASAQSRGAASSDRIAYVVQEASTGAILAEHAADAQRYPASLTKVMTLYLLFEALEEGRMTLDTRMPVSAAAEAMQPMELGVRAGQTLRVRDAILSMTVQSANDSAVVVAEYLAGSERAFARMMTQQARDLGMENTTYRNASGWHDPRQVTTARDQLLLAQAMYRDFPAYYEMFGLDSFQFNGRTYTSHNDTMGENTRNGLSFTVDGLKTGYIRASGFNLMTSAVLDIPEGDVRLNVVYFGGRNADQRNEAVLDLLATNFPTAQETYLAEHRNRFYPILTAFAENNGCPDGAGMGAARTPPSFTGALYDGYPALSRTVTQPSQGDQGRARTLRNYSATGIVCRYH